MDLAEPASAVMSRGSAALLRVLAGADDMFTGRQLARLAGVSSAHAAQMIDKFAEHGLVLVEHHGAAKLARFNRDHLAAEAIVQLTQLRSRLRQLLATEISAWPVAAVHVSLFGSAARGDGDVHSDLDVLVVRFDNVAADDAHWVEQMFTTAGRIRRSTGNDVSWFDITMDDLRRALAADEPVIKDWSRDAVNLYGSDVRTLLRSGRES